MTTRFGRAVAAILVLISSVTIHAETFQHESSAKTIVSNWTALDHPELNGRPEAVVVVRCLQGPSCDKNLGVWYEANAERWAIFHQDRSAMEPGTLFEVVNDGVMLVVNDDGKGAWVDTANFPEVQELGVTPVYNPNGKGGVYVDRPIAAVAEEGGFRIAASDGKPLPAGAAFAVRAATGNVATAAKPPAKERASEPLLELATVPDPPSGGKPSDPRGEKPIQPDVFLAPETATPDVLVLDAAEEAKRRAVNDATNSKTPAPSGGGRSATDPAGRSGGRLATVPRDLGQGASPSSEAIAASLIDPGPCRFDGNWSFERGLECWRPGGGEAFSGDPATGHVITAARIRKEMDLAAGGVGGDYWKDLPYPIGHAGDRWIAGHDQAADAALGRLTSATFPLAAQWISFLLGGGRDAARLYVALQVHEPSARARGLAITPLGPVDGEGFVEVARVANFVNSEELQRRWIGLSESLGSGEEGRAGLPARITIVDQATGGWGHLNVDDFRFVSENPANEVLSVRRAGYTWTFDRDMPVWGFADTHAHPAHHLGFGGNFIRGDISRPMSETYARSVEDMHWGTDGHIQHPWVAVLDPHGKDGWPSFIGYPRFDVWLHQQHHPEWLKRAWEGGERLLLALAVNNQYTPTRQAGPGVSGQTPTDDDSQMELQIAYTKRLVAANPFMEIAYTPADARRIILEGKMAVVLGIETDNFGNFKDESYVWNDARRPAGTAPLVTLPREPELARPLLSRAINRYWDMGVRQATPMHYIDGVFGGVAQFRFALAMLNRGYTGRWPDFRDGGADGLSYNISDDFSIVQFDFVGSSDVTTAEARDFNARLGYVREFRATAGAQDLSPRGRELMQGLMAKGMLIDSDHLSILSKRELVAMAGSWDYPVYSSHSDPSALSFSAAARWSDYNNADPSSNADEEARWRVFGTTFTGDLSQEGQVTDEHIGAIRQSGGMVSALMIPYRKKPYSGTWGRDGNGGVVSNSVSGSTQAWAQLFLHMADRMGGRGVALSTDRGAVDFISPRFGPHAAWPLTEQKFDVARVQLRNQERFSVGRSRPRGVRYDAPLRSFHSDLFEGGQLEPWEEDTWKALAFVTAFPSVNPRSDSYASMPEAETVPIDQATRVPASADSSHRKRIESFVQGWHAAGEAALTKPYALTAASQLSDEPWEEAAFHLIRTGQSPCTLRSFPEWATRNCDGSIGGDSDGPLVAYWRKVKAVHDLWKEGPGLSSPDSATRGGNAPLRRLVNGERSWDFNLDGMAHYGLMPDFMQDLRNVGMNARQMSLLFRSAEDYIRMWEQAERSKVNVPAWP